jgi:hypothetical protein
VILNANFEINNQKRVANIVVVNENHSKVQWFHVKFCYLINFFQILWITTKRGCQNEEGTQKKVGLGTI